METTTTLPEKEMSMRKLLNALYDAFTYFNFELFNNLLPDVSISIGDKKGASGVFYAEKFVPKEKEAEDSNITLDDILLNPKSFNRDEEYILSVLVHEMVHQWELHYGKPAKGSYHNREWVESMKSVGLFPSSTGEPGGKETGHKVSHYIIEGGLFSIYCAKFIEDNQFSIDWFVVTEPVKSKTQRKRTYRCLCEKPVYANHSELKLMCMECDTEMIQDQI